MSLPSLSGVARVVADPEVRFTTNGNAVASVRLAFNSRRRNQQTGEWEDGDTCWIRGTAWNHLAENIAETLSKGMEVTVTGELRTESWEKDGQKQQAPALLIRSIGPNLAYATAAVKKATRDTSQAQHPQRPQQAPQADPWATSPSTSNEPPF
ncbi:single-stranded DNA-binding protein [Streptomyces malaysiensis subsp. malaysiensis]|uniref:single-stranded DNA-binding protein n=1 Tax=Streptomyces malaysiensis TaxID=92644 RepID=UPI0024BFD399|nr:single-stranded DNA-binding protein [Streptomyces sp. NA07423]WHX19806.1 single-stranded DNA-binding protein [Streptomyces sp. NA07423]